MAGRLALVLALAGSSFALGGCGSGGKSYSSPAEIAGVIGCDAYQEFPPDPNGGTNASCTIRGVRVSIDHWPDSGGREAFVEFAERTGASSLVVGENWVVQVAPGFAGASNEDVAAVVDGEIVRFPATP